jgi:hypothetical protein
MVLAPLMTGFGSERTMSFYDVLPTTTRILGGTLLVSEATSTGSVAGGYYNALGIWSQV